MGFFDVYFQYKNFNYEQFYEELTDSDILKIIHKDRPINEIEFLALLSPKAENYLELMAQKAHTLSLQHFGKTVLLYTPMYLSNYCTNKCTYCSFSIDNQINRKQLSTEEIEREAKAIASMGFKHLLILTGESKKDIPLSYVIDAVHILKKYFDSIGIEIFPLTVEEYQQMIEAGVDSFTIYQEVYDEEIYRKVHLAGRKRNYHFRLDAPERGCMAKMRNVNIGALLGLGEWRSEAFMTGLHANYLQNKYPDLEISVSFPRIRPHVGVFEDIYEVTDQNLVQFMLALRIFLPRVGITISTRERQGFRENLIPLGVTRISAASSTEVGGHSIEDAGDGQFEIDDKRSVEEVRAAIFKKGYQPIFKDWVRI
ncbi:2-iminoacetate synthase ThiH [Tepidibacillus marianensis]|uniref:2-iminoacetate synthase ThiH n=1 Tax=Tepidibacillus marianensis TaxID=3131995 RepID=UPI0030D1E61C